MLRLIYIYTFECKGWGAVFYDSQKQYLSFLEKLKRTDNTETFLYFLAGVKNNADGVSGGQSKVEDTTFPEAGPGLVSALPIPWQL